MLNTRYPDAVQKLEAQAIPPSLIVEGSGRQICLPPLSLVYLGRCDKGRNIFPHVDLTSDGADTYGVSRRHACIRQSVDGTYIEDLGSTNGTFINGQRLSPSRAYALCHGDVLHLGQLKVKVAWLI